MSNNTAISKNNNTLSNSNNTSNNINPNNQTNSKFKADLDIPLISTERPINTERGP